MILKQIRTSILLLLAFTALTGVLYPLVVTAVAQILFPSRANGSLIERNGSLLGSELIGQSFDAPRYFWGRPSATTNVPYDARASSGSNLGPSNPVFLDAVRRRVHNLRGADSLDFQPVPVDLVTASGSGLDPHISVMAALVQVPRVARERGLSEERIRALVQNHSEGRQLGFLGEPRINVLLLNLDLDTMRQSDAGN